MGVEVRLGHPVTEISSDMVSLNGEAIPAHTVIWAAGVRASAAGEWLKAKTDKAGRVIVKPDFSVSGGKNVFVIGDTAAFVRSNGQMLPGVAPAAKQAGDHVGKLIASRVGNAAAPKPFAYVDHGNLATIGRKNAVADFGSIKLKGFVAWLLWSIAHVYFLIGFRNRFVVAASWLWSYLTYQRGARLITGRTSSQQEKMKEAA
jgi:NADH dehydrogenase